MGLRAQTLVHALDNPNLIDEACNPQMINILNLNILNLNISRLMLLHWLTQNDAPKIAHC